MIDRMSGRAWGVTQLLLSAGVGEFLSGLPLTRLRGILPLFSRDFG